MRDYAEGFWTQDYKNTKGNWMLPDGTYITLLTVGGILLIEGDGEYE